MVGRTRMEAGLGISASPLQCAGHDDPLQGPAEVRRCPDRRKRGRALGSCPGRERQSPFPLLSHLGSHTGLPAILRPESSQSKPAPSSLRRETPGEKWTWGRQDWCGQELPARGRARAFRQLSPSRPVVSRPCLSPSCWALSWAQKAKCPVSRPRPSGDSSRIHGTATPSGS